MSSLPDLPITWCSASVAVLLIIGLFIGFRPRKYLPALPGPPSTSWLVGNLPDIQRVENVGDAEFKWVKSYGNAFKIKGAFGEDIVHITDPKALQHVLSANGYGFRKPEAHMEILKLSTGKGVAAVEGADHARHRKIMNPAFAYTSVRGFLPMFNRVAVKLANKWREKAVENGESSSVIDVANWLPRLTLDVIGEAALNVSFGSLDNGDHELTKAYENLFTDTFHNPSDAKIAFIALWAYMPTWVFSVLPYIPLPGMKRLRNYLNVAFGVAKRIVDSEVKAISEGKPPGKDAMSILVRANFGENPKGKLSDHELLAEMTTLLLAGHETTASTLSWLLYELSRRLDFQHKIHEEIKATRARAAARGDENLSIADLESMAYTVAAMKETLRVHPIIPLLTRIAEKDDVIPLSKPQRSLNGESLTAIPVCKGQKVMVSICAYNRLKDLWGENAHQWMPERFLEDKEALAKPKVGVGVYANLATFGNGVHSCIGWRFGVLEMQAVMVELLEVLEFAPPPGNVEIIRAPTIIVTAMVKGQTERGIQMPLTVTPL